MTVPFQLCDTPAVVAHQAGRKIVPVPPPVHKINSKGIAVLNARRAGNVGKSKRRLKTTPVFG
jgi:hypothetical protein